MTVLKATFRTNDEYGPVEIKLTWHKQLNPGYPNDGYTVTVNGEVFYSGCMGQQPALFHAIRLYRKFEKSNERATAQSKTT